MTSYAELQEAAKRLEERTPEERQEAAERILRFITSVRWQFAKTMPLIPHEYTVLAWRPDLKDEFVWFARTIVEYGRVESWGRYRNSYYYFRRHKYWTMDDPIEATDLINRESTTETPCQPDVTCEH